MGKYELLKRDKNKLNSEISDQAKHINKPTIQKAIPNDAILYDLIPYEQFKIGNKPVLKSIYDRRSKRKGSDDYLTLEELSYLLFTTNGVKDKTRPMLRCVPSAGARHPFETYIQVVRVNKLKSGLYRYLPLTHQLLFIKEGNNSTVIKGFLGQDFNGAVMFMWSALPYRTSWRYGSASEKLILLDAGHICQNLYIACDSINLGTCAIGAYDQDLLDKYLNIDGQNELVVYNAIVVK